MCGRCAAARGLRESRWPSSWGRPQAPGEALPGIALPTRGPAGGDVPPVRSCRHWLPPGRWLAPRSRSPEEATVAAVHDRLGVRRPQCGWRLRPRAGLMCPCSEDPCGACSEDPCRRPCLPPCGFFASRVQRRFVGWALHREWVQRAAASPVSLSTAPAGGTGSSSTLQGRQRGSKGITGFSLSWGDVDVSPECPRLKEGG